MELVPGTSTRSTMWPPLMVCALLRNHRRPSMSPTSTRSSWPSGPKDAGQLPRMVTRRQPGGFLDPGLGPIEAEPEEIVGTDGEQIGMSADGGEAGPSEQLDWLHPLEPRQVELDGLGVTGEIGHDQDRSLAQ